MDTPKPQISFIIVNFQSRDLLERCISSIQKLTEIEAEIVVVNNDSEPLPPFSQQNYPTKIIQAGHNLGFGAAVNLSAKSALGEYLFLLNPDAEIISASLHPGIDEFKKNNALAILGGKIVNERSKTQDWIAGNSITPWQLVKNNLGLNQNKFIAQQKNTMPVDWVSGGAMLIRKSIFQKLGGFDEKIFLYWEDIDLCRRVRNMNFDILYFPNLVVRHLGGQSFNSQKEQKKYYYQSQDYYFQKHFGKIARFLIKWLRIFFSPISYIRKNS